MSAAGEAGVDGVATTSAAAAVTAEELARLSLPELVAKLEPIPEPMPISYFPETGIWLWIAAGLALVVLLFGWLAWRRWKARAYRRAALAELRRTRDIAGMARILRRTALAAFPREDVAGLIGEDWLDFLDRTLGRTHDASKPGGKRRSDLGFRTPVGRRLLTANYVDEAGLACASSETAELRARIERWVREHRVDVPREVA